MDRVKALYDFKAEANSTELSINTGDVLTVTRRDAGEGWYEGRNRDGKVGLFPAAYVEDMASEPPSMPPPPFPAAYAESAPRYDETNNVYSEVPNSEWGNINEWQAQPSHEPYNEAGEDWDEDWDDDSETGTTQPVHHGTVPPHMHVVKSGSGSELSRGGTVGKKSFNRFSSFVKSGGEGYILGNLKITGRVSDIDKVSIVEGEDGILWDPITAPYSCMIASPKKESKLKGLKSYIAYQLTPTFNNIQVSRRYKHFDWLHERLEEKFGIIPIPPLPDKQISGRYEEQFIEHRKTQLQAFVNCVCRHPVLSKSHVWLHFITCTDEKQWKTGKRKAERDELIGAKFFLAIQAPERELESFIVERDTEDFSKFVLSMDSAIKMLVSTSLDQTKKYQGAYKKEYDRIANSFIVLANACELDKTPGDPRRALTQAIRYTGNMYLQIGELFEEQPRYDWEPMSDVLHIYKGIISSFPDILNVHKNALNKQKECEKLANENKLSHGEVVAVRKRTDVVSYSLLAEINHFHNERAEDFKGLMKTFLAEQIRFHQNLVDKFTDALKEFDY